MTTLTLLVNDSNDREARYGAERLSSGAAGNPRQTMLIPAWWWVISARTYLDRLTNAPDLLENAKRIKCPVLFIRGDQEPKENYPAETFQENCAGSCEVVIVPNCDHFYVGAENRVSKIVTVWLEKTLG